MVAWAMSGIFPLLLGCAMLTVSGFLTSVFLSPPCISGCSSSLFAALDFWGLSVSARSEIFLLGCTAPGFLTSILLFPLCIFVFASALLSVLGFWDLSVSAM